MNKKLYGLSVLGRFGLTHRLMAWARCVVWCTINNAELLYPNWYSFPIGPWLRREKDKRLYYSYFRNTLEVFSPKRLLVLLSLDKIPVENFDADDKKTEKSIVVFRNSIGGDTKKYFPTLIPYHKLIRLELEKLVKPQYLPGKINTPHIAIHIRFGDFTAVNLDHLRSGSNNIRIPLAWYIETLQQLRKKMGFNMPAYIYSDANLVELSDLLEIEDVYMAENLPAITHLFLISQSNLLIGSGSGFTLWGSFLGQVPRICFTGQRYANVLEDPNLEIECENIEEIPIPILNKLLLILKNKEFT